MSERSVSEAEELVDLAERMGIPTTDAVQRAVRQIIEPERREGDEVRDERVVVAPRRG